MKALLVTHNPYENKNFRVIEGEFKIRGDDEMSIKVSRNDQKLSRDDWTMDIFKRFSGSYITHNHAECEVDRERKLRRQQIYSLREQYPDAFAKPLFLEAGQEI